MLIHFNRVKNNNLIMTPVYGINFKVKQSINLLMK